MELRPTTEIAIVLFAALAAGSLLTLSLAGWIGRRWAERVRREQDRGLELQARKAALLLDKEFEATSALVALLRQFLPTFHFPAMEWEAACNEIAYDFAKIDTALGEYLARHGAVLPLEVMALLGEAIGLTREHRFKITSEVPPTASKAAATLFDKLWKAEAEMLRLMRS
ncbi:hypothetical protein [Pseudomonas oryzae]|uniref:DUF2489 domain-containing protein n=1 Tax=Pseudomonas oryzae TaxID=1392877 RepID=A0A1H1NUT9_9PSED|nr:hypothetical protein [Pseudomonas oryzae]SDS02751.1 hypothetical protein SAMN05216221_0902 [Pseudomonas oryzae]